MDIACGLFVGSRLARHSRILAGAALALVLAAPGVAFGQQSSGPPATFNERYPAEQPPAATAPGNAPATQPASVPATPPASAAGTQEQTGSPNKPETVSRKAQTAAPQEQAPPAKARPANRQNASPEKESIETTGRVTRRSRARSRIIVERRSFLDAGTEVRPGDRKFLDYAFPPLHQPTDVVTNTGGRTGWHNWPLPGPLFPSAPQN
jgi:hypothetical protein